MKTVSQITTPLFTKITACERVWFSNIDALEQLDWGQRVKAGEEGSKCCHGELIPHRTRVTGSHGSADVQSAGFSMTKFEHFHGFTSPPCFWYSSLPGRRRSGFHWTRRSWKNNSNDSIINLSSFDGTPWNSMTCRKTLCRNGTAWARTAALSTILQR